MPLAPSTLLKNRYRIVSILGQGGMGAVYRANDEHLLIPVAVKENLFLTEEYGRQFRREAHILAGLRHPGLPHVTDYFALENQGQYLVMDFVEGEDLRQRMERMGALPEREVMLIGISICDALSYLHNRRPPIIHRDIKPGNIKVTPDGQAVLVDFGLAKIMLSGQATSTGARAMTPGYSPPEQYGTSHTDSRSDIYSLGATLYAALTGVIPEDGLARMTNKARLTPVRDLMPKVNRKLADAVEKALAVEPDDRYQLAEDFRRALIESGELVSVYQERPTIPPPPVDPAEASANNGDFDQASVQAQRRQRSMRLRKRRRLLWTAVPLGLLVAMFAGLMLFRPELIGSGLGLVGNATATITEPTSTQMVSVDLPTDPTETPVPDSTEDTPAATETPIEDTATEASPTDAVPNATPPGGGMGQIAFASNRTGVMQIYLANANVENPAPVPITNMPDGACQPSWSPDGQRLAFTSPCPNKQDKYPGAFIYLVDIDNLENPVQFTSGLEGDYDPAWSPDGRRIAFTSLQNGIPAIYVLSLEAGSQPQKISGNFDNPSFQPAWSPFGNQIAFVRQFSSTQIWVMTDTGGRQDAFSMSGPINNFYPSWSIDGQLIYYSQGSSDNFVPYLVYRLYEDRENSRESRIPAEGGSGPFAQVRPSPDGTLLAYESWPADDNHDIYIMNINGSNQRRLTTDPGLDFGAAWRPYKD